MKYRRKTHDVDALLYNGKNRIDIEQHFGISLGYSSLSEWVLLGSAGGSMQAWPGDWIVRRPDGVMTVMGGAEFTDLYEPA